MKIVTYNVNGLRQRISQFGSLLKLLNSFDADIICFQETKLRKQELTADLVIADGYESFFSCTRTSEKGRMGYSGVATFCRVKSAFSSNEVALPVAAEEGFTGLLHNNGKADTPAAAVADLEEFGKDGLLQIDSEGRCIITDHGQFVLFNIYGPRAEPDDTERIQFKLKFYKILQRRWEYLLQQGRRVLVLGDLNIAPASIDRCDAGPDFEKNMFRTWLRSMIVEGGGHFFDVFRAIHPDRRDAYTCWSSNTGAEQFNFGSRIDHILGAGSCFHQESYAQDHNFVACHVKDCDILTQYKRWKPGDTPRWKGGWNTKLEGSDHAPVYASLVDIPNVAQHDTPPLSSRYLSMIRGLQQTLVSMLMKRQVPEQVELYGESTSFSDENMTMRSCSTSMNGSTENCLDSSLQIGEFHPSLNQEADREISACSGHSKNSASEAVNTASGNLLCTSTKKARKGQLSQLSLKSFFQKSSSNRMNIENSVMANQVDIQKSHDSCSKTTAINSQRDDLVLVTSTLDQGEPVVSCSSEKEKNNMAVLEWRRIQQVMQNKIPSCKGHNEPCVSRIVKKAGPNFGRRFYTCARAEGPASNPEANCGFFKWAGSKAKQK